MARTGILGGTFDPPHLAHLALATAARDALSLDRVVFVPAGMPWRKSDRVITPAPIRLAMVRAAVAALPWAEVSTVDIDRTGPSYTIDTLDALGVPAAMNGASAARTEWWFILGADALADLPRWHRPLDVIARVRLAVAARPGGDDAEEQAALALLPGAEARIDRVPMVPLAIAATAIRRRVAVGGAIDEWVPEAVRAVINAHGLYRDTDRASAASSA